MAKNGGSHSERRGVLRLLTRWLVRRHHPRLEVTGGERIPQQGPVLICANHPNSLLDPVLIGIAARRPVQFLAKSTLFDIPLFGAVMRALGMVPMFRGVDDSSQVRRNFESIEIVAATLAEGGAMGIFPEGKSTDVPHVDNVGSGAARMALQGVELGAEDLVIVPVGLTYERKDWIRSAVWIQVGRPIDVAAWLAQHDGDAARARRALSEEIRDRLREVVVHLDEPEWEPWLDDLQTLAKLPGARTKIATLKHRCRIANAINHFLATDRPRAEAVAASITAHREAVHAAGLRVNSVVLEHRGLRVWATCFARFLWLLLGLLPAAAGTLHHVVPFVITRLIAARFDQGGRMAVSTIRLLAGLPIYALWYVAVGVFMFDYYADWFAKAWLIAMPVVGVFALHYWRTANDVAVRLWHQTLAAAKPELLRELRASRTALRTELDELSAEFAKASTEPQPEAATSRWRAVAHYTPWLVAVAIVVISVWTASYWILDPTPLRSGLDLSRLAAAELRAEVESDERALPPILASVDGLESDARRIQKDFMAGRRSYANQGDDAAVRDLLRRYIALRDALFRLVWKYQRHAEVADAKLRQRAFLLDYVAASVLYEASLRFVHEFGDRSPRTTSKLNEAEPAWGIRAGVYDDIRRNVASPGTRQMLRAAKDLYDKLDFKSHGLRDGSPYAFFHDRIAQALDAVRQLSPSAAEIPSLAIEDLGKIADGLRYEVQSFISTWIGDAKLRKPRQGRSLISKAQLERLRGMLRPGDILIERRNWYLSNAFLPGYWPHAALYVGSAAELEARGLHTDPDIAKHWERFRAPDHEGHQHVIIEAVSEGVVMSTLEHSVGEADAVAVLRPRLSRKDVDAAIRLGFRHVARPYDFEFDFETTDRLVCTEVVFRSYGGNAGALRFPLEQIMGRMTMPAINLVRKFRDERGGAAAQLDFIAMLDGDEQAGTARFVTDATEFVATLERPALTWLQSTQKPLPSAVVHELGWLGTTLLILTGLGTLTLLVPPLRRRLA